MNKIIYLFLGLLSTAVVVVVFWFVSNPTIYAQKRHIEALIEACEKECTFEQELAINEGMTNFRHNGQNGLLFLLKSEQKVNHFYSSIFS